MQLPLREDVCVVEKTAGSLPKEQAQKIQDAQGEQIPAILRMPCLLQDSPDHLRLKETWYAPQQSQASQQDPQQILGLQQPTSAGPA